MKVENLQKAGRTWQRRNMGRLVVLFAGLLVASCATNESRVGLLSADSDIIGVKLLRPNLDGRSCRVSVFGWPLAPGEASIGEALGRILEKDAEGDLVTGAEIRWIEVRMGIFNRSCVEVRGDLGRAIRTLLAPGGEHRGHVHDQTR